MFLYMDNFNKKEISIIRSVFDQQMLFVESKIKQYKSKLLINPNDNYYKSVLENELNRKEIYKSVLSKCT